MDDPVVDKIIAHLARMAAGEVPDAAYAAAKTFLADTLAVGIAGAAAPWRREVLDMAAASGGAAETTVWGTGEKLPLAQAAMVNAYQVHSQEFDCVHEGAVVHPMAAVLSCALGWAERDGNISGEKLLRAVIAGVDVAVNLGLSSRAPMRFFRPANCGGFGGTAALALLADLDQEQTRDALGIYYGQCSGTMQAHVEASPQLAMQMGFAARAAVTAVELARRGMPGPRAPISGEFGYFALFDGAADPAPFDNLGRAWRICELSHKPWPSGRATHGGLDGLQQLVAQHGIRADRVTAGRFFVPPLTYRLVGRPAQDEMEVAYARLCLPYVGAVCLRRGTVGLGDFTPEALGDPDTLAVARRLSVIADANPDPNALHPVRVELDLADGRKVTCDVAEVLGSPARPLPPEAARAKFAAGAPAALWDAVMRIEGLGAAAELLDL
ncbi:MAG: MmgE/PrpD family protein [Alphaproteobacteria bacterium]|nr:MmgE/PrpD family protein [Alphaproteobacteria bacterium]